MYTVEEYSDFKKLLQMIKKKWRDAKAFNNHKSCLLCFPVPWTLCLLDKEEKKKKQPQSQ